MADNRFHRCPFLFHIGNHFKLGAGAVQILAFPLDGEIIVAVQMIGQEPQTTFQRHELGTHGQHPAFFTGQAGTGMEETAGVGFKQLQIHGDFVQILFILGCGRSAEAEFVNNTKW